MDTVLLRKTYQVQGKFLYYEIDTNQILFTSIKDSTGKINLQHWRVSATESFNSLFPLVRKELIDFKCEFKNGLIVSADNFVRATEPIASVSGSCPICGSPMTEQGPKRATRDHIYPREWNRKLLCFNDVDPVNIKMACLLCNRLRGMTNHCVGALACVRSVADDSGQNLHSLVEEWQFNSLRPYSLQALHNMQTKIVTQTRFLSPEMVQFKQMIEFLSQIDQSLKFGKTPYVIEDLKGLTNRFYNRLLEAHYIEKTDDDQWWWFTESGIEFHTSLWHKEKHQIVEDHLFYVLKGFLYGLFNTNNSNLSRKYDGTHTYKLYDPNLHETIIEEISGLFDTIAPEQMHGIDLNDFCFDIIQQIHGMDRFFYLVHSNGIAYQFLQSENSRLNAKLIKAFQTMIDTIADNSYGSVASIQIVMTMIGFCLSILVDSGKKAKHDLSIGVEVTSN